MEIKSGAMPEKAFQILHAGENSVVEFFDNARAEAGIDERTGQKITVWRCEKYVLTVPCSPGLAAEIENNYAVWLKKAKDAELAAEAEKVRKYRNGLLDQCDAQYCITAEWEAYKQALRDVPAQEGFPYIINWPVLPAEQEE